jgi:long-chain acyl-CoA synthetase
VVPNKDNLLNYLKSRNLMTNTEEGQDAVLKLIESEIAQHKGGGAFGGEFPERWLPAAVAVLGEGFTEQNHFLNSTLKMVRGKITEFYRDRIDYLFTTAGKEICNQQNRMIVKRMG